MNNSGGTTLGCPRRPPQSGRFTALEECSSNGEQSSSGEDMHSNDPGSVWQRVSSFAALAETYFTQLAEGAESPAASTLSATAFEDGPDGPGAAPPRDDARPIEVFRASSDVRTVPRASFSVAESDQAVSSASAPELTSSRETSRVWCSDTGFQEDSPAATPHRRAAKRQPSGDAADVWAWSSSTGEGSAHHRAQGPDPPTGENVKPTRPSLREWLSLPPEAYVRGASIGREPSGGGAATAPHAGKAHEPSVQTPSPPVADPQASHPLRQTCNGALRTSDGSSVVAGPPIRVLIVDDVTTNVRVLRSSLMRDPSVTIETATDGDEMVDLIVSQRLRFDVVLLDEHSALIVAGSPA